MITTTTRPNADWAPPRQPDTTPQGRSAKNRTVKVLALLAVLALAASAFIVASLAVFTDSEIVDDNNFASGTVDISTNPTTQAFNVAAMAPGDEYVAPITVTNAGSLDLRYAMDSMTTLGDQTLADALVLTVSLVPALGNCTVGDWDVTGTIIAGTAGTLSETPARQVLGDPAQGNDAGDRPLAAGASEILCMHVELPLTTDTARQGESVQATFGFDAEQTDNN